MKGHYQRLGSCSVDDAFDDNWVDSKVNECHRCSVEHDDPVLDRDSKMCNETEKITKLVVVMDLWEVWRVRDVTLATQAGLE